MSEPVGNSERNRMGVLKEQVQQLVNMRTQLDPIIEEIIYYVRQNTYTSGGMADFGLNQSKNEIFDSTAPWAAAQASNGLGSYLVSATDRWFRLGTMRRPTQKLSKRSRLFLEDAEDRIFYEYSLPEVGFSSATSENFLDLVTLGSMIMFQDWDPKDRHIRMIPYSITNCYFAENQNRRVDTLFRKTSVTVRNILQWFPSFAENESIKRKQPTDYVDLWHGVFPNKDRSIYKFGKEGKAFSSVYFSNDLNLILDEGGYSSFPYHVSRWMRLVGDVYGQGPAHHCLPAIRNANQILEELHIAARLANAPPYAFDDDSILLPMGRTSPEFYPGSLVPMIPGSERPQPLMSGSQPQYSHELLQMQQKWITDAFMVSYLLRDRKKERQSITEILDERGEMLRQLGSVLGRQNQEYCGPMVGRTYQLLRAVGEIDTPPDELVDGGLDVVFINAASKAQLGTKAQNMSALLQDLSTVGQAKPEVFDILKPIEWANELAELRDVSPKVLNSKEELAEIRAQQAQQAQQQQMMEAAPGLGKAMKDVADARQTDPEMAGLLGM